MLGRREVACVRAASAVYGPTNQPQCRRTKGWEGLLYLFQFDLARIALHQGLRTSMKATGCINS
jgi:hypothetical protein